MRKTDKVAIGRIVLRTRESPVAVRATEQGLAFSLLYHGDEVRSFADLQEDTDSKGRSSSAQELMMAEQLIAHLAGRFRDTYRERVLELVHQKEKGGTVKETGAAPAPEGTRDLMEALKQSLSSHPQRRAARLSPRRAQPSRPARARRRG
jgi:DNA end-binding protein Ku